LLSISHIVTVIVVFFVAENVIARHTRCLPGTPHRLNAYYLWSPYVIGQTIIFLPCGFFLSSFFSSPNLSSRRLHVYHTSSHGVALV